VEDLRGPERSAQARLRSSWAVARRCQKGVFIVMAIDPPDSRKALPVRFISLHDRPADNLAATTTAEERVAMIWQLTLDAWALAGRPIAEYRRDQAPVRIVTLAEHGKASDL
jgi:hypothetical protein